MIKDYVWRGGGVPGGGFKHAGHADWFIEMNPISNQAPGNPPPPSAYSTPYAGDLIPPKVTYRQKKVENVKKPAPGSRATIGAVPGQMMSSQPNPDGRPTGPGDIQPYDATDIPPSESGSSDTLQERSDTLTPEQRRRYNNFFVDEQLETFQSEAREQSEARDETLPVQSTFSVPTWGESYTPADPTWLYEVNNAFDRQPYYTNLQPDQVNPFASDNVERQQNNQDLEMTDAPVQQIVQRTQDVEMAAPQAKYNPHYFDEMGRIYGKKFPETTRYRKRKRREAQPANKKSNTGEMEYAGFEKGKYKRSGSAQAAVGKQRMVGKAADMRGNIAKGSYAAKKANVDHYEKKPSRKRKSEYPAAGTTKKRSITRDNSNLLE